MFHCPVVLQDCVVSELCGGDVSIMWALETLVGRMGVRDVTVRDHVGKSIGFAVDG